MTVYLSNFNGDGMTDEEGHFRYLTQVFDGAVAGPTDVQVTQNSPLGMSVLVTPGDFKIDTGSGYAYMGWNNANAPVTINTADAANPRIDAIVIYVDKLAPTAPSPPNNPGVIKIMAVAGTPSGVPVAPNSTAIQTAVGAGNPWIKIAEVRVNAGVTQITNSNITDTRVLLSLPSLFVGTTSLQDSSVTNAKLATNAVSTAKVQDGAITDAKWRNGVAFSARSTVDQNVSASTFTNVNLQVEDFDIGNNFSGSAFTAPYNGIYFFTGYVALDGTNMRSFANLTVNNLEMVRGTDFTSSALEGTSVSSSFILSSGDVVRMQGWRSTNGTFRSSGARHSRLDGFMVTRI